MKNMLKTNTAEKQSSLNGGASIINPLSVAALLLASLLSAHAGLAGHWEAEVAGDGSQRIRVSLDLDKNAKSEWIASLGLPADNKTGLVVKDVTVNGNAVKFVAVELMMTRFNLTLGPEGTLKGRISGRASQSVEFKRTGKAKVELIPASHAVSTQLEGDWEGSLQTPNRTVRMLFHFKNQPDKTVMATFGTGNAADLPLNNVKQTGRKVEFGMRVAHGHFQGTLNKEGTELAGQFTHEENSMPLTLRKKRENQGEPDDGGQPSNGRAVSANEP